MNSRRIWKVSSNAAHIKTTFITDANLKNANLEGSHMFRAELRVASLKGASLRNCDLRRATLAGADLEVRTQPSWDARTTRIVAEL